MGGVVRADEGCPRFRVRFMFLRRSVSQSLNNLHLVVSSPNPHHSLVPCDTVEIEPHVEQREQLIESQTLTSRNPCPINTAFGSISF